MRVQTILGTCHCLVTVFMKNKDFNVALPILVQITQFLLHYVLLICRNIVK